jgi:hypothetical protein
MNHIFLTFSSKYQGETMFCFVCVATVFGYILGVNRVIDAIISKQCDETRVKTLNKYTQTNFGEIAELLASNHLIASNHLDISSSSDQVDNSDVANETNNEVASNSISHPDHTDHNQDKQEKKEDQEKQVQENAIMSPSSASSVSTSEEDYELVRKNENVNHSKNKNNSKSKYFEWLTIF